MFRDKESTIYRVYVNIVTKLQECHRVVSPKRTRNIRCPIIDFSCPVGFFDGLAYGEGCKCGVGAIIDVVYKYHMCWNCGRGNNTRGELLALWALLWIAKNLFY